jgi:hypothetical protein
MVSDATSIDAPLETAPFREAVGDRHHCRPIDLQPARDIDLRGAWIVTDQPKHRCLFLRQPDRVKSLVEVTIHRAVRQPDMEPQDLRRYIPLKVSRQ